jgi:hypothetical protein
MNSLEEFKIQLKEEKNKLVYFNSVLNILFFQEKEYAAKIFTALN